jgi:hypothetical protein
VFCTKCGAENPADAKFCQKCGQEVWHGASASPADSVICEIPVSPSSKAHKATTGLSDLEPGVKGWLKFLCISLTILSPLVALGVLGKEWGDTKQYFYNWPSLKTAVVTEIWLTAALVSYGVFAGYRLCTLHPLAVTTAKRFLWLQCVGVVAISALVIVIADLPDVGRNAMMEESFKSAFRTFINSAIWLAFLSKSKRVKVTYPQ